MYRGLKFTLLKMIDVPGEVAHLALGAAIFATCLAVTKRPILSFWLVAGLQAANELLDAFEQAQRGFPVRWSETASDTIWTLALPLVASVMISASVSLRARVVAPGRPK